MSWKRPPREEEGLMPKIMALLAPPSEFENKPPESQEKNLHNYFKVPGKGHNRDLCDSCGEGGDIICCDRCPSSFHMLCHEPPVDVDDLPQEWMCRRCSQDIMNRKIHDSKIENDKKRKRSNGVDGDEAKKTVWIVNGKTKSSLENGETQVEEGFKLTLAHKKFKAVEESSNSKSFRLAKKYIYLPNVDFPGESRSLSKRPFEVCENGIVHKPFKLCFVCRRTCRHAPLLSCDFCSLFYHLDCLTPPLAHVPTGLWMCPNHPHQFIEEKRLVTDKLSERLRYWDLLSKPIDQDEVQIAFLRQGSRKFPPFRRKLRLNGKLRIRVPEAIKHQYQNKLQANFFDESLMADYLSKEKAVRDVNETITTEVMVINSNKMVTNGGTTASTSLRTTFAFLVPIDCELPPFPINKTSVEVGTQITKDIYLPYYGSCQYISENHCVIFLDKLENTFELINYSNFGTIVDGINYVIGDSGKIVSSVSDLRCKCRSNPNEKGWESSAVLKHGSKLDFGCISFLFCLTPECTNLS